MYLCRDSEMKGQKKEFSTHLGYTICTCDLVDFELKKFVYYEERKRELYRRLIYECRCDERLKAKDLYMSVGVMKD
jgi:hypothetical protein